MKLGKVITFVLLAGAGFYLVRAYQPSVKMMYPQECAFLIDDQFSSSFRKKLQEHALHIYRQSRDPQLVIDDVAHRFPEVSSMDAHICKTDKVCFTFDGAKPLFKLNDALVVCNNHQKILKDCFNSELLDDLHDIKAQEDQSLQALTSFFTLLPKGVFDDFDVLWTDEGEVALQTKTKKPEHLFFSSTIVPTQKDIDLFKKIQHVEHQKGKKKKKIYDFRFKNQIVIR